jgi:hypothetical protein
LVAAAADLMMKLVCLGVLAVAVAVAAPTPAVLVLLDKVMKVVLVPTAAQEILAVAVVVPAHVATMLVVVLDFRAEVVKPYHLL